MNSICAVVQLCRLNKLVLIKLFFLHIFHFKRVVSNFKQENLLNLPEGMCVVHPMHLSTFVSTYVHPNYWVYFNACKWDNHNIYAGLTITYTCMVSDIRGISVYLVSSRHTGCLLRTQVDVWEFCSLATNRC